MSTPPTIGPITAAAPFSSNNALLAATIALGVTVGWGIFYFFAQHLPPFSLPLVYGLSLLLAIAGVAGDLAESLLKRSVHSKDSGHALPGIGGGLDLIDSLLFTLPLFYFILLFVLHL